MTRPLLTCGIVAVLMFASNAWAVPLTLLPSGTLGRCLDGTNSGYYLLNQSSTSWVFAFDGGGECNTKAGCESKLTTSLGSSKYFAPSTSFDGQWFLDTDPQRNPGFHHWNKVRVPYCTQDLHMGTVAVASASTYGLLFSGQLVWEAILAELDDALRGATDIMLSGESAGGIATWPKLDAIAARFPRARVSGAPIAGFYSNAFPYTGPDATPADSGLPSFSPSGLRELYALYQPSLNAACVAAHAADPSPCLLSNNSLPFIHTDVFVTEALTDSVQLTSHDNIPAAHVHDAPEQAYIAAWSRNMTAALSPVLGAGSPASRGGFAAACFMHTGFTSSQPLVGGVSFLQAAARWYEGTGDYKLADNCPTPFCNPTCPA